MDQQEDDADHPEDHQYGTEKALEDKRQHVAIIRMMR